MRILGIADNLGTLLFGYLVVVAPVFGTTHIESVHLTHTLYGCGIVLHIGVVRKLITVTYTPTTGK